MPAELPTQGIPNAKGGKVSVVERFHCIYIEGFDENLSENQ